MIEKLNEVDDILRSFEDWMHNEDGDNCTHARNLLIQVIEELEKNLKGYKIDYAPNKKNNNIMKKDMTKTTTLYEFLYCSCIHESALATISLHFTKKGANEAMKAHKQKAKEEWNKDKQWYIKEGVKPTAFGKYECWTVKPITVLP